MKARVGIAYRTPAGARVPLGSELGRGRSGIVYVHGGDKTLAVKIWHRPSHQDAVRLRAMLGALFDPRPQGVPLVICWPVEAVLDEGGELCGFVMPAAGGFEPKKLSTLLMPMERERLAPNIRYETLLGIAATIADAVDHLHRQGVIVGDLNDLNVTISADGIVSVLDCDSMQFISRDGVVHVGGYYRPEYLAPEFANVDLNVVPRTIASDTFALTEIIFQLLMGGFHPFAAVVGSGGRDTTQGQRAAAGEFAYSPRATHLAPPPGAPPYEVLPGNIGAAFMHTFEAGTHADRRVPLSQLGAVIRASLGTLATCSGRQHHTYPAHLRRCPWCHRGRSKLGSAPAPGPAHVPQPPLDVGRNATGPQHVVQPPLSVGLAPSPVQVNQPQRSAAVPANPVHVKQPPLRPGGVANPSTAERTHARQPSLAETLAGTFADGRGAVSALPLAAAIPPAPPPTQQLPEPSAREALVRPPPRYLSAAFVAPAQHARSTRLRDSSAVLTAVASVRGRRLATSARQQLRGRRKWPSPPIPRTPATALVIAAFVVVVMVRSCDGQSTVRRTGPLANVAFACGPRDLNTWAVSMALEDVDLRCRRLVRLPHLSSSRTKGP